MKADGRAQRKEGEGEGWLHWLGAQLCIGARPGLTCEPNYGMEGEGVQEEARGGGVMLCVRRAWCGHAAAVDGDEGKGEEGGDGVAAGCFASRVRVGAGCRRRALTSD